MHDQIGSTKFFKWQKDTEQQTDIKSLNINNKLANDREEIDRYIRNHYAKRFTKAKVTKTIDEFGVEEMRNQLTKKYKKNTKNPLHYV